MKWPLKPTVFDSNPFNWDWHEKDFFHSPDGTEEFPDHHCKQTWMVSLPFIMSKKNAIDVGCRDGEYARYIHKDFEHVYCFDYRQRKRFHMNVDLKKITHFKCALGDEHKIIKVSGAGSITAQKIPLDRWYNEQLYTIDEFNFENIDYIKIDVDGYELPVLKGAIKTIEKYKPVLVLEQEFGETAALKFCIEKFQYKIGAWDPLHRNVVLVAH